MLGGIFCNQIFRTRDTHPRCGRKTTHVVLIIPGVLHKSNSHPEPGVSHPHHNPVAEIVHCSFYAVACKQQSLDRLYSIVMTY